MLIRLSIGMLALAAGLATARGDDLWIETVDLVPTRSIVELPTVSTIVPTSYVARAATIVPTSAYATVYDLPASTLVYPTTTYLSTSAYYPTTTTYVSPTRYAYRAARYRRRYREASYLYETAYVAPTTLVAATGVVAGPSLIASSALCCETTAAPRVVASSALCCGTAVAQAPTVMSSPQIEPIPTASPDRERSRPPSIESTVKDDPAATGAGRPGGVDATGASTTGGTTTGGTTTGGSIGLGSAAANEAKKTTPKGRTATELAPAPPASEVKTTLPKDGGGSPPDRQEPDSGVPPLPPPPEVGPLPKDDQVRTQSYKPNASLRPATAMGRNILRGRLVAAGTREPEEGVELVVSDRGERYIDRTTRTDAYGQFAMSLPEGDWTIKVRMPSGRVLAVGQGFVTAGSGRVLDMYGRELGDKLVIQR